MCKIIYSNTLADISNYIPNNTFVIIDSNLKEYLKYFKNYKILEINTSEHLKNLESIELIINFLLENNADRNSFILGVGGGITTDMVGFAASIYKRGVSFGFVPSTLLSQSDASIGGKNGVNFKNYKNIIGAIVLPQLIFSSTEILKTLKPREFKAGIAEIIKTAILFSKDLYQQSISYFTELENYRKENGTYLSNNGKFYKENTLSQIINTCANLKCKIVEKDKFEKGERRLLNLGHSFAHAIEKELNSVDENSQIIMHGEAVAIGIIIAAQVAEKILENSALATTSAQSRFSKKLINDFIQIGIPTNLSQLWQCQNINFNNIIAALAQDKKAQADKIHFILPYQIEKVEDTLLEIKYLEEILYDLH